ncbi:hypothetical protein SB5439_04957 [Klebsiella variicola]|uniref:hypothetical protein n=1 Tax=Klebsiella variicola TaxID=244366 RepID=UPI00109C40DA|nr:hypothetical protein [Klebsiella variicola]VGQ11487.1 hypothetical protein SB5439_04957 [Klebsiella variicola]
MSKLDQMNTERAGSDLARPKAEERKVFSTRLLPSTIQTLKDIKYNTGTVAQYVIEEGIELWIKQNLTAEGKLKGKD